MKNNTFLSYPIALIAIVLFLTSSCATETKYKENNEPSWLMFVEGSGSFDATSKSVIVKKDADVTVFTDRPYHISETASGIHDLDVFVQTMIDDGNPPNASFAFAKSTSEHIGFVAEITSVSEDNETVTLGVKALKDLDGNLTSLPEENLSDAFLVTTIDNWWHHFWRGFKKGFTTTAAWVGAAGACAVGAVGDVATSGLATAAAAAGCAGAVGGAIATLPD